MPKLPKSPGLKFKRKAYFSILAIFGNFGDSGN